MFGCVIKSRFSSLAGLAWKSHQRWKLCLCCGELTSSLLCPRSVLREPPELCFSWTLASC